MRMSCGLKLPFGLHYADLEPDPISVRRFGYDWEGAGLIKVVKALMEWDIEEQKDVLEAGLALARKMGDEDSQYVLWSNDRRLGVALETAMVWARG